MTRLVQAAAAAVLLSSFFPHTSKAQVPPVRERLGGRIGYIDTYGAVHEHFGGGWNANLYFTERIYRPVFLDIRLGAIYLGDLLRPEIAENLIATGVASEMRILFFSLGPQLTYGLGGTRTGYLSAGLGVYSVSMQFATSIQALDFSDQHLGGNGSVGMLWRFTDTWNLDLNLTAHHFRTSDSLYDLFYRFTGDGAEDPWLLQAAAGITIDLR